MNDGSTPSHGDKDLDDASIDIGDDQRDEIARMLLKNIDERRAVHRARTDGLSGPETAALLGMTTERARRVLMDVDMIGDSGEVTPEEVIMRSHLERTDRGQLMQSLREHKHRSRPSTWTQIQRAFMYGFLSEEEVNHLRWVGRGGRAVGASWHPIRAPRGLDCVVAALPQWWSHSHLVSELNRSQRDLDHLTAIEWLQEEGSPVLALLPLLTPAQLVLRARALLGAKLVAYVASERSTRTVDEWARGVSRPSEVISLRLGAACCAAGLLRDRNSAEMVQVWFQGQNIQLRGTSPARTLRDEPAGSTGIAVLVAARRAAGFPL